MDETAEPLAVLPIEPADVWGTCMICGHHYQPPVPGQPDEGAPCTHVIPSAAR